MGQTKRSCKYFQACGSDLNCRRCTGFQRRELKMKVIEVIESKRWRNTKTGQTASIYGAVPYQGDQGPWIIETIGFTWRLDNGTVGLGRMPAKTRAEAEEIMRKVNNL